MAAPGLAPGLQRKLKKVLDMRTEAPELAGSLATLSSFYGDNTPAARRHLRSAVEAQAAAVDADFVAATAEVLAALDAAAADLDAVAAHCDGAAAAVGAARAAAAPLLHEAERLESALERSRARSAAVASFLGDYQLAPGEAAALESGDVGGEPFFAALARVRAIHANCRALLRGGSSQRAGLDLMDSMAALQERAFERLARWVRDEAAALADADAPEAGAPLARAAAALRARPALARFAADEVAAARHAALFRRFIAALTRGPRPIEVAAGDPWRYASDMLAWVHTALASESEFFEALFGGGGGGDGDAAPPADDGGGEPLPTVAALLDAAFEGVVRPLRVRLEQVLLSAPPPLLAFRLAQLLAFYDATVAGVLGPASGLGGALRACRAAALRTFHDALRARGDKLARYPPPPPRDLSPPPAVLEGAALAAELIACFEGSMAAPPPGDGGGDDDFDAALGAVLGPLADAAERSSEALNPAAASRVGGGEHLRPGDARAYVVNCLAALAAPLAGHACAARRAAALDAALEAQLAALVAAEAGAVLARCGLAEVAAAVAAHRDAAAAAAAGCGPPPPPLAADPALALPRVAQAARTFFGALSDPAALPEFAALAAPRLRRDAAARALRALAEAYEGVHGALHAPGAGYRPAEVADAVRHTPAQVRTLLGVAE